MKELAWNFTKLTTYAEYELCSGCFSINVLKIFKAVFPKNTSEKIILLKGIIYTLHYIYIYITFISQTIKIWLNLLSGRGEGLIIQIVVSTKKNTKAYGETNAQRGQLSENNCQSFNSNSKITSFLGFFRKKCFKTALMCNFCPGWCRACRNDVIYFWWALRSWRK